MSATTGIAASTDAMAICAGLEREVGGVLGDELHFFAYLACLIAVYDGWAAADWGYSFTATAAGAPFAPELARAADSLRAAGLLVDRRPLLSLSSAGTRRLDELRHLSFITPRLRFLKAATAAATLMPLPSVRDAMAHEPQLRQAMTTIGARELLDRAGLELVQEQFDAVRGALAEGGRPRSALVVPALVWLTYLAEDAANTHLSSTA